MNRLPILITLALAIILEVDTYHQQERVKLPPSYEQETSSPVPYHQQETNALHPRYEQGSDSQDWYDQYDSLIADQCYFGAVGIPLAKAIYQAEYTMMMNNKGDQLNKRIIGGDINPVGQTPFLGAVYARLTDGQWGVCSCNLLSRTRAVTAAHCWFDGTYQAVTFKIRYGSAHFYYGGLQIETSNVTMHENYDTHHLYNDIAMIIHPNVEYTGWY